MDVIILYCRGAGRADAVFDIVDIVARERARSENPIRAVIVHASAVDRAILDNRSGRIRRDIDDVEIRRRDRAAAQSHIRGIDIDGAMNVEPRQDRSSLSDR